MWHLLCFMKFILYCQTWNCNLVAGIPVRNSLFTLSHLLPLLYPWNFYDSKIMVRYTIKDILEFFICILEVACWVTCRLYKSWSRNTKDMFTIRSAYSCIYLVTLMKMDSTETFWCSDICAAQINRVLKRITDNNGEKFFLATGTKPICNVYQS